VMSPLVLAALMYAYEDIFGGVTPAATVPPLAAGPSGTIVMPVPPPKPPNAKGETWTPATKIGMAVVVLVLVILAASIVLRSGRSHGYQAIQQPPTAAEPAAPAAPEPPAASAAVGEPIASSVFSPVTERELTNLAAIKLVSGEESALPVSVAEQARGPEKDSAACAWLEQAGMDFAFVDDYDGFYGMTRDLTTLKREDWESASPDSVANSVHDTGQDVAAKFGEASRLNPPTNFTYGFKTRDRSVGMLQIMGYNNNPPGVKIRYKLAPAPATNAAAVIFARASRAARDELNERLEAASNITDADAKDKPLAALASDAAKLGEADVVRNSLSQMIDQTRRDEATHEAVMLLAKRGLKKPAIDLAKGISEINLRDRTLVELAQQHSSGNPP